MIFVSILGFEKQQSMRTSYVLLLITPLRPRFDTRRPHMRWSRGHQIRQVGFLRALRFPPTRRPSERKHWCQRA